jgi:hypothetical protein
MDLLAQLLPRISAHRLDGFDAGPGMVYPYYNGLCLTNLPASICRWLGAPELGGSALDAEIHAQLDEGLRGGSFRHVILLVVDGLGLDRLQEALAGQDPDLSVWRELAESGLLAPLTSIAPSTTASALTTFWTGVPPAAHGVLGYELWLKEYGVIANMIRHSPASFAGEVGSLRRAGFDPETFLPVPTFGPHLKAHGVHVRAYQHHAIARSGLSTMLMPGVETVPFRGLSDLFISLEERSATSGGERLYSYIYWGDLDEHMHLFGPQNPRVTLEFAAFSRQLRGFLHRLAGHGDTLLLITADHGHISTPRAAKYELRNHPDLLRCMAMLPSSEARLPFVFLRPGSEQRFLDYLEEAWPGQFRAFPAAQALEAGLFGADAICERTVDRLGDYLVVPQGSAYWWFANRDNPMVGRHGGLSQAEMLVPLLMSAL